jgi:arylsulfatase A-like enzyme
LAVLVPLAWVLVAPHHFRPVHAGTVLLAGLLYPALGSAIGVLALRRVRPWARSVILAASLAAVADASAALVVGKGRFLATVAVSGLGVLGIAVVASRRAGPFAVGGSIGLLLNLAVFLQRESAVIRPTPLAVVALGALVAGAAWRRRSPRGGAPARAGRRTVLRYAVAWAALAGAASMLVPAPRSMSTVRASRKASRDAPNVVMVTLDTVRADHLGLHGYGRRTTPHLDALAAESTVYLAAQAAGDMTLTSHASLFTGRHAFAHRARPPAQPLPADAATLAEVLASHGYRTAAVVANTVYLREALGLAQGFLYYDQRIPARLAGGTPRGHLSDLVGRVVERVSPPAWLRPHYRQAAEITEEALRVIGSLEREGAPFLLFLNYMDAHTPYLPPPPYDALFPGKDPRWRWDSHRRFKRRAAAGPVQLPGPVRAHLESQYDGGIAYADAALGRVLARLRELDLYEDSMIVVTSDHGEAFGEHGLFEHGVSVHENQVHVPLIVKFPGSREARRVEERVSAIDVMPTVLEVVGARPLPSVQGRSLKGAERGAALSESFAARGASRALTTADGLKLIERDDGSRHLFDLAADPHECVDLWGRERARGMQLSADLRRLVRFGAAADAARPPDAGLLEELRALGYLR